MILQVIDTSIFLERIYIYIHRFVKLDHFRKVGVKIKLFETTHLERETLKTSKTNLVSYQSGALRGCLSFDIPFKWHVVKKDSKLAPDFFSTKEIRFFDFQMSFLAVSIALP